MVACHSGRSAAAQGSALLSPLRRKRRYRICRLCLGAEFAPRYIRHAGAPPAGRRSVHPRRRRRLSRQKRPPELSDTLGLRNLRGERGATRSPPQICAFLPSEAPPVAPPDGAPAPFEASRRFFSSSARFFNSSWN